MKKGTMQLETLTCPSCIQKIEGAVKKMDGIQEDTLKISFNSSKVKFDFDEEKVSLHDVEKAIVKLGYDVLKSQEKEV